jgi:hypothetical protein
MKYVFKKVDSRESPATDKNSSMNAWTRVHSSWNTIQKKLSSGRTNIISDPPDRKAAIAKRPVILMTAMK